MKSILRKSRDVWDIGLVDLPIPDAYDEYILAKVAYAGICGSDLDIINSRNTIYRPPVVQGHEFSAVIEEVGDKVKGFKKGDKIVSETTFNQCGKCKPCQDGNYHLCEHKDIVGWTENGAFAEHVLLNNRYVHKLDDNVDLKGASLIEPMAIASEAVLVKGQLKPGETVAVIGPGATGILSAIVALESGASKVFLIGRNSSEKLRFKIAREIGIELCINSSGTDVPQYIMEHNSGASVDMVIDSTGNINGFNLALDIVKRNGRIVELGSITTKEPFNWQKAAFKALDLLIVFSSSHKAWKHAVAIYNHCQRPLGKIVTHTFPLENYKAAFDFSEDSSQCFKVAFVPNLEFIE
ncbi:zinc-dependent alcohol dehydrogenase [Petrimonas sp.]|uniref:zinc-dependent alcohol dehydrogenase n=1 Tax=Petrimonas sp. TaxID=2023866 RepID=UPI002FC74605